MKPPTTPLLIILVSLFFAGAILVSSYLLRGTDHGDTATYFIVALWFIPFSYLCATSEREKIPVKSEVRSS
ncbi:MAG: hypothetical protein ACR2NZ_05480 [Rubripirellula sp.]